jgi:hypothetical protein
MMGVINRKPFASLDNSLPNHLHIRTQTSEHFQAAQHNHRHKQKADSHSKNVAPGPFARFLQGGAGGRLGKISARIGGANGCRISVASKR